MANSNGTPVWFELTTPDADKARAFYESVAGWQVAPSPNPAHGGYLVAGPDARNGVAGLMTARQGMPTGWTIYFGTADVDAMARRVADLGGRVHVGPMDIPDVGRFAAVTDAQGLMFNLMSGNGEQEARAFMMSEPGSDASAGHGVWVELRTPDPDGALAFYGELFGWQKGGAMPMGDMGEYAFISRGGDDPIGAIMSSTLTRSTPGWNWYVHVADIDAAIDKVTAAGGSVRQGPDEIPGGAFSANVADAQGFNIGLVGPRHG